ncbi:hypothetical protein P8452_45937 [Trifolium repens]|nr:hypothetical protein P8452_45937 [Trifolium repens]
MVVALSMLVSRARPVRGGGWVCSIFTFRRLVDCFSGLWFSDLFPVMLRAAMIKVLRSSSPAPDSRFWVWIFRSVGWRFWVLFGGGLWFQASSFAHLLFLRKLG